MNQVINANVKINVKGVYSINMGGEVVKLPNTIDTKLKQLFAQQLVTVSNLIKMDLNVNDGLSLIKSAATSAGMYMLNQSFKGGAGNGGSFSVSDSNLYMQLFGDLRVDTDTTWGGITAGYPDILETGYTFSAGSFTNRISSISGFDAKFDTGVPSWTSFFVGDGYVPIIWELSIQGTEIDTYKFAPRLLQGMRFSGNADSIRLNYLSDGDATDNSIMVIWDNTNSIWRNADDGSPRIITSGGDGSVTWVKFSSTWTNDTGGNVTITKSQIGKGDSAGVTLPLIGLDYPYAVITGLSTAVANGASLVINWTFNF